MVHAAEGIGQARIDPTPSAARAFEKGDALGTVLVLVPEQPFCHQGKGLFPIDRLPQALSPLAGPFQRNAKTIRIVHQIVGGQSLGAKHTPGHRRLRVPFHPQDPTRGFIDPHQNLAIRVAGKAGGRYDPNPGRGFSNPAKGIR